MARPVPGSLTAPAVCARALQKTYRMHDTVVEALRDIDLAVPAGEFVALMGPSGCGKSTLLNLLGGLDEPTSGTVHIAGRPMTGLTETERALLRRTHLGFVFQSFDLLPLLSVLQNVEFPLAVAGVSGATRRDQALDLLSRVGLADKRDAMPDELSGGQKQRVAIARTLARAPSVILADEPTGSLDSLTGSEVITLLRETVVAHGATLVMVTHDAEDARRADRIIHLLDGRVVREVTV